MLLSVNQFEYVYILFSTLMNLNISIIYVVRTINEFEYFCHLCCSYFNEFEFFYHLYCTCLPEEIFCQQNMTGLVSD